MQFSHQEYTNKLLLKASNMKQTSPVRKRSMIGSIVPSLGNENDQMTDRIKKQMRDKHRSCSNIEDFGLEPTSENLQFLILTSNAKQTILNIEKKLKNFKYAKENDHNSCASTIAKMKCFCLDNCCFDFYRCTDLIVLKYMIYLLIQEINSNNEPLPNPPPENRIQKNLVKEAIAIMHETVEELKNQHIQTKSLDQLNKQIKKMQQTFGLPPNFDNFTTPQSNIRKLDIFPLSATQKREYNQTSPSVNSQKIIQFQIDELQMKNDAITKLNYKVKDLEQQVKQLNQQLSEANLNLSISQKSLQNKEQELKDLIRKTDKLLDTTSQAVKDKEQYVTSYNDVKEEHNQLKNLFDDLQRSNLNMKQEYHILRQSFTDQGKNKKEEEKFQTLQLQQQLQDKNKIIQSLAEDGQSLAQQLQSVSNKIMQVNPDQLPYAMQQLQRDLYLQDSQVNVKLNKMHLAQKEMQKPQNVVASKTLTVEPVHLLKNNNDYLNMLVVQCEVIEKFISN